MPSTPEFRRRILALALYLLSIGGPTQAQAIRSPCPRPDIPTTVARRISRQVLLFDVPIALEGGCFGSGFVPINDYITASRSNLQGALTPVHVIRADTKPPAFSTQGLTALVRSTG
jgi:hypothetical protein